MNFKTFDVLFAAVVLLAAVAAVSSFYLENPYPAVVVAAFAGGGTAFLYLTLRVKIAGILKVVEKRLADAEASFNLYRDWTQGAIRALEDKINAGDQEMAKHIEKTAGDVAELKRSLSASLAQYNANVERAAQSALAVRQTLDATSAELERRLAANEKATQEALADVRRFAQDFNDFVVDEQLFRKKIEDHVADRVAYLEDFIREKRKSLQI